MTKISNKWVWFLSSLWDGSCSNAMKVLPMSSLLWSLGTLGFSDQMMSRWWGNACLDPVKEIIGVQDGKVCVLFIQEFCHRWGSSDPSCGREVRCKANLWLHPAGGKHNTQNYGWTEMLLPGEAPDAAQHVHVSMNIQINDSLCQSFVSLESAGALLLFWVLLIMHGIIAISNLSKWLSHM